MDRTGGIRIFEDGEFQSGMALASGVVLAFGLVLGVAGMLVGGRFPFGGAAPESALIELCLGAALLLASFAVHELVHGLFFKLFAPAGSRVTFGANWRAGMLYACAEGIVYARRQYQVIILAPTIAVTILLVLGGMVTGHGAVAYVVAVLHLSGCTGDWGYLLELVRRPDVERCMDTDWGVAFLHAGEEAGCEGPTRSASRRQS